MSKRQILRSIAMALGVLIFGGNLLSASPLQLNVTDFGAIGDVAKITVNTTSNSSVLVTTNEFQTTDIGKIVCLFGGGASTTPTNNQDLLATIVAVTNGTNVTIDRVAG